MAAVCVEEIWAVLLWHAVSEPYVLGQRAVHAWWWGGGIDVVHERGSERIGIFVVLRRHTRSQRHTCGHRAIHVVHGERWERYTWPHTHGDWGGMHEHVHETREVAASRERPMRTSKNIGVFCGYTLVSGLSRGYTWSGGAHAAVPVGFASRREKGIALAVARRLDFVWLKG